MQKYSIYAIMIYMEGVMQELEQKLVELSFRKDELKKMYEDLDNELNEVCNKLGVGYAFQDNEGTIYKVDVPKGTYVSYKPIGFVRTKRGDERAGTLSQKEAQELLLKIKK